MHTELVVCFAILQQLYNGINYNNLLISNNVIRFNATVSRFSYNPTFTISFDDSISNVY